MLQTKEFSTRSLIRKMKVEIICTTDDPADNLEHHLKLKGSLKLQYFLHSVPIMLLKTEDPEKFKAYISKLEQASDIEIKNFETLIEALDNRHKFFHRNRRQTFRSWLDRFYFADYTCFRN